MTTPEAAALAEAIKALAPVCKAHGIRRVKLGEVELEFGGGQQIDAKAAEAFSRALEGGQPTDEDLTNWHLAGYVPSWERAKTDAGSEVQP